MRTINFSAYAASAGAIGKIDIYTAETRKNQLEAQSEVQKMNGDVAQANSQLISDSGHKQAEATRDGAWGSIGSAATGIGSELVAGGYEVKTDDVIKTNQAKANTLDNYKETIKNTDAADLFVSNNPAKAKQTLAASQKKLENAKNLAEQKPEDFKAAISHVKGDQNPARESKDCLDRFSDNVENEHKKYQNAAEQRTKTRENRAANIRSYGRAATDLSRGISNQLTAAAQADQANLDEVKKQAEFSDTSAQAAVRALNDSVSSSNQQQQGLNDLVNGLIRANTIN